MIRFYSGVPGGVFPSLLCSNPSGTSLKSSVWSSCKLTARCCLLFQRRISLFASTCALSCRRIGRENYWWYNCLPSTPIPLVKPNLPLCGPVGVFWIGCLRKRELCCYVVPSRSKSLFEEPQNFQTWVKEVEGSDGSWEKDVKVCIS